MVAPRLYVPSPPVQCKTVEELSRFLFEELKKLSLGFERIRFDQNMDTVHTAPEKPTEGMYVKADGTNWNPGSGTGPYMYISGTWVPMFDTSGASPNTFGVVAVSGQSNVVADASSDTLTMAAGSNITITTNAATDTVTIAATVPTIPDVPSMFIMAGA